VLPKLAKLKNFLFLSLPPWKLVVMVVAFVLVSNRSAGRKGGVWKLSELSEPNDIGNAEDMEVSPLLAQC
jgi:hypothetical protein